MDKLGKLWRKQGCLNGSNFCILFNRHICLAHRKIIASFPLRRPKLYLPWPSKIGRRSLINANHFPRLDWTKSPVGICSLPGRRKKNEDRYCVTSLSHGVKLCAVFDGHRGSFAAKLLKEEFPALIEHGISSHQSDTNDIQPLGGGKIDQDVLKSILESTFAMCQENLKREILAKFSEGHLIGATAVVALLSNSCLLTVGQVGDSKMLLCRGGEALTLTEDHTPDNDEETKRIVAMKGWIDWDSKMFPLVNGQLQMTRSMGDLGLKEFGVVANPTIKQLEIDKDKDAFLVLCSDGVTHTISDEEIVHIVAQHDCPNKAAETLACSAQQYGSSDDVTCLVIPLGKWGKVTPVKKSYSHFRMAMGIRGDG